MFLKVTSISISKRRVKHIDHSRYLGGVKTHTITPTKFANGFRILEHSEPFFTGQVKAFLNHEHIIALCILSESYLVGN